MNVINISDFRNNISEYINRVIYKNESILLKRGKTIVAKLASYKTGDESHSENKIKKFAGILSDKETSKIKKEMKKFRKNLKLLS